MNKLFRNKSPKRTSDLVDTNTKASVDGSQGAPRGPTIREGNVVHWEVTDANNKSGKKGELVFAGSTYAEQAKLAFLPSGAEPQQLPVMEIKVALDKKQKNVVSLNSPTQKLAFRFASKQDAEEFVEHITSRREPPPPPPPPPFVSPTSLTMEDFLKPIPSLLAVEESDRVRRTQIRETLLQHKCRLCCIELPPRAPGASDPFWDGKKAQLLDLIQFFSTPTHGFQPSEEALAWLMGMFAANLLRPLPFSGNRKIGPDGVDESPPTLDKNWGMLSLVYEFLLRFVVSPDSAVSFRDLCAHITGDFVRRLLANLDSDDPRERECVKTILHRIYAKFMSRRTDIRKHITDTLSNFRQQTTHHGGVPDLLEILGPIISGYQTPLKPEHRDFCLRVLVPLYKARMVSSFSNQLGYCLMEFVQKDHELLYPVVTGLLAALPAANSNKTLIFINTLEDFLEAGDVAQFQRLVPVVVPVLARLMVSDHFQVCERALFMWHNDLIHGYLTQCAGQVVPLMYRALNPGVPHWNASVDALRGHVVGLLAALDPDRTAQCAAKLAQKQKARTARAAQYEALAPPVPQAAS